MEIINTQRKLEWFLDFNKTSSIVEKHLLNQYLYIKSLENPPKIKIIEKNPNQTFKIESEILLELDQEILCYKVLGRYLELYIKILTYGEKKGTYNVKIEKIGVSLIERDSLRIPILNNEVYLTNFLVSKHLIDPKTRIIPTTIKIGFSELENKIKPLYDYVKIDTFENFDLILDKIQKTGKFIFIKDTYDSSSFDFFNEDCLNLKEILKENINQKIHEYRKNQIKSEIIAPLLYLSHDRNLFPIGYIRIYNKNKSLDLEEIDKIRKWNQELIDRMQQLNTTYIQEKEQILNISKNGFRARIKNVNLINYLVKQSGFYCDIVFREEKPIPIFAEFKSAFRHKDGKLDIGAKIVEFKKEKDRENYLSNIDILEKKYQILKLKKV
ncbi:MAG: DUF1577 domain-containing protein [Leptonema sp. (in: bacteria)]